nr:site-specific integrase [Hyphomonas sp.]
MSALAVSRLSASAFVGGAPGLQLSISPQGTRTWRLYYRLPGDSRRRAMSLGRFPAVSLSDARQRAGQHLSAASQGADPKAARNAEAARTSLTLREAVEAYLAACTAENAPRTVDAKASALRGNLLPAHGRRLVAQVSKGDIARLLDTLADRPALRRNLHAYLRHFFSWCAERDLVADHPLLLLRAPRPVTARERVLSDDEIRAVWLLDGSMATIAKMALLTAQRKGSIERMRWSDLDLGEAIWTIPAENMKSGRGHSVPLSPLALHVLDTWPRFGGPYVFGIGSRGTLPFNGASNGIESLRRATGTADWRLHDLRRTAVTLAQRGGSGIDEIRALTQHKIPGIIGVYARHTFDAEKRQVVTAIAAELNALVSS